MALYTVTVRHPKGNAGLITVREEGNIYGTQVGVLRNGTVLTADLDFKENGEVWGKIIANPVDKSVEGYFAAFKYGTKIFASWLPLGQTEEPMPKGELYYVKEDWFTERWGYKPRPVAPDPGIFPLSSTKDNWPQTDFCWLPARWQWFWIDLMAMRKYGKLYIDLNFEQRGIIVGAFKKTTTSDRAFNNQHGTDIANCYPCKQINRGEDAKQESLVCCGAEILVMEQEVNVKGWMMGQVYSFLLEDNPPVVTAQLLNNDPRIFDAKVVNPGHYLTNFTGLGLGIAIPVPILTNGYHWYRMSELRKVTQS